jgi:hypothetical protein
MRWTANSCAQVLSRCSDASSTVGGMATQLTRRARWRDGRFCSASPAGRRRVGRRRPGRSRLRRRVLRAHPEQTEGPYYIAGEKYRRNHRGPAPGTAPAATAGCRCFHRQADPPAPRSTSATVRSASTRDSAPARRAGRSCAGSEEPDARALARFRTVYRAGTGAARCTSTREGHVAGTVVPPASSTSRTRCHRPGLPPEAHSRRPPEDDAQFERLRLRPGGGARSLSLHKSGTGYVGAITMGVNR